MSKFLVTMMALALTIAAQAQQYDGINTYTYDYGLSIAPVPCPPYEGRPKVVEKPAQSGREAGSKWHEKPAQCELETI